MNRKIKIPTINNGEEFEVPERKVKHTRYTLRKTIDSPEDMKGYDIGYHSGYIVLKDVFPDITEKNIDELDDSKLNELSGIIWNKPDTDFQQPDKPVKKKN